MTSALQLLTPEENGGGGKRADRLGGRGGRGGGREGRGVEEVEKHL